MPFHLQCWHGLKNLIADFTFERLYDGACARSCRRRLSAWWRGHRDELWLGCRCGVGGGRLESRRRSRRDELQTRSVNRRLTHSLPVGAGLNGCSKLAILQLDGRPSLISGDKVDRLWLLTGPDRLCRPIASLNLVT